MKATYALNGHREPASDESSESEREVGQVELDEEKSFNSQIEIIDAMNEQEKEILVNHVSNPTA